MPLDPGDNWSLDIDRIGGAIRPNTRLVTINFPHNPTGTILPLDRYMALVDLCRTHGIYILHDEIFNGLGPSGAAHLPFIADVYERGPVAERDVEVLRPARFADRVDRLSGFEPGLPDGADEALSLNLQFRTQRTAGEDRAGQPRTTARAQLPDRG